MLSVANLERKLMEFREPRPDPQCLKADSIRLAEFRSGRILGMDVQFMSQQVGNIHSD
jgi:hypothetical protein